MNVSRTAQNSAFKNHPIDIVCSENHLYRKVLVHIIHKTALNTTKHLQVAGYKIFKNRQNSNFSITVSPTDHSRKPRAQMKQCTVTILHYNKFTGGMCLLGFRRVYVLCALSFLLSSIRLFVFFFIQRNHIEVLIFHINTFFKQHNRCHKLFKAFRLRYCTEVPVLHNRSQDHAHSLFYVYQSRPRPFYASCICDHTPSSW